MSALRGRPEATRDTTVGTPGWRRHIRAAEGQTSHRAPSLILDALVQSGWRQTWTA